MCTSWAAINVASDTSRAAALGWVVMMGNWYVIALNAGCPSRKLMQGSCSGGLISTWSFLPADAKKGTLLAYRLSLLVLTRLCFNFRQVMDTRLVRLFQIPSARLPHLPRPLSSL